MCLATPMKIIKITGDKAIVNAVNHTHTVDLSLVKNAKIGDYIIAHRDMAIHKIPTREALKILKIIRKNH